MTETTCAVCRLSDGLVLNIIIANPSDPAPNNCQLVEIMTGQMCDIGWYYANSVFNGPRSFAMCLATTNEVVSFFSASYASPVPTAPTGYYGLEVPQGMACAIGWTWDGVQFNPPVA
jgi:hypothetical protein